MASRLYRISCDTTEPEGTANHAFARKRLRHIAHGFLWRGLPKGLIRKKNSVLSIAYIVGLVFAFLRAAARLRFGPFALLSARPMDNKTNDITEESL
jgi:hypothetical protein